ncbi:hypothetical protein [Streptomyces hainanensis]|uniref:Antitoxin n=1 Tax=Streptomyces hainanensis TaxID=402648 RepID=A0A4R4SEL2_9ACTN|nr:hypothetical protein [Streptomyces hainanensis]TDC60332.1 hypothetical protein E1283_36120 [Streptomyces hainanensis]
MGLFDMFRDKAAELAQSAMDQLTDLTGAAESTGDAAGQAAADGLAAAAGQADQAAQSAQNLQEQGQDVAGDAGSAVSDQANRFLG